jgi:hypothetical protein
MEEKGEADETDILEIANVVAQYRWSSLQLCMATSFTQVAFRNSDGFMIAHDRAIAAFLGDVVAFGHHRQVVVQRSEVRTGGIKGRRREVDALRGKGGTISLPLVCVKTLSGSFPCDLTVEANSSRHDLQQVFDWCFGDWKCRHRPGMAMTHKARCS